ncbi:uncharacterized protein [Oscarella lobularis]|uniref:uncharacterized protein isoform X2 n=1 Tax=Oscarella lobularis TaxID=121494 RepID=UPI003313C884
MFRAAFSCVLLFALSHDTWGEFAGYNLPCFKDICGKPCADLGKELQYFNVSVSNWPIQPGSQIVLLNVTLLPTTNLTDLSTSIDAFGVMASSNETIHCAVTDYLCGTDDKTRWENKICPIPAFKPTTYAWPYSNEDVEAALSTVVSGNVTVKIMSFDKKILACVRFTLTKNTTRDFSPANAYAAKKTKRLFPSSGQCGQ